MARTGNLDSIGRLIAREMRAPEKRCDCHCLKVSQCPHFIAAKRARETDRLGSVREGEGL